MKYQPTDRIGTPKNSRWSFTMEPTMQIRILRRSDLFFIPFRPFSVCAAMRTTTETALKDRRITMENEFIIE